MSIEEQARKILEKYPIYKELPASISGKYHIGETQAEHLDLAYNIMQHLCDEFNIHSEDRDLLLASILLHDLGLYVLTIKGKVNQPGWKYYEETGYSRVKAIWKLHGQISANLLDNHEIDRKEEIKRLVSVHMSHWLPQNPQPENLYEYLICLADYIASKGKGIFKYERKY